jgi:hypothetical protein
MIVFAPHPIPVIIKHDNSNGYVLYIKDSGMFENDEFCVVSCEGGQIRHYTSEQILIYKNATFNIQP